MIKYKNALINQSPNYQGGDWNLDIICDKNEVDNLDEWLSFDVRIDNWDIRTLTIL